MINYKLQTHKQKKPGETIKETSRCVRPEQVKWPNCGGGGAVGAAAANSINTENKICLLNMTWHRKG